MTGKRLWTISLALVLISAAAHATTLVKLNTEALVKRSDAIVVGKVSTPPVPVREDNGLIYTKITVYVSSYIKRAGGAEQEGSLIELRQLGGTMDGKTMMVPGMPSFQPDEKVLLFLRRDPKSSLHGVVGLAQGKYEIRTEPSSGREYIVQSIGDVSLFPARASSGKPDAVNKALLKSDSSEKVQDTEGGSPRVRAKKKYLDEFIQEIEALDGKRALEKALIQEKLDREASGKR